jgi:polar amino acid transport system substrate-binding protein
MRGTRVGTLSGALSERVLNEHKNIQTHLYPHEHLAHEDLLNGRIDALLFDAPIVSYYSTPNPKFKVIGKPISKMQYGIVLSKKNPELLSEINQALKKLIESGKLRNILERWNLWNSSSMPQLTGDLSASRTRPVMYEDYLSSLGIKRTWSDQIKLYQSFIPGLLKGAWMTLVISVLSMIVAMSFGLLIAVNRLYSPRPLSTLSTLYIELIRGTPLLLQLFFIFYGLPHLGIKLSPLVAAVLALGFNYAANEAENYRAGIEGVAKTQKEAAWSLGLNTFQSLRHVIIPQGIRLVIPPVTTDFISLIKDSSLVSMITLVELTKAYGQLSSTYYDFIGPALMAAALYLLMGLPFVRLARYLEQRWQY